MSGENHTLTNRRKLMLERTETIEFDNGLKVVLTGPVGCGKTQVSNIIADFMEEYANSSVIKESTEN